MNILVAGGTGFVGRPLVARLLRDGHAVTILTRSRERAGDPLPGVTVVEGNPGEPGAWQDAVADQHAVINLAGASIFGRWTAARKRRILESRVNVTRNIVQALGASAVRPRVLVNASAVGYYGPSGDDERTEESAAGNDFLARVARDWETEALRAREAGARVALARLGIVLGRSGGALRAMLPAFRAGLGGPIGGGGQWFSWIHLDDAVAALLNLLSRPDLAGPVNVCAPCPVRQAEYAKTLGAILRRPAILPIPSPLVKVVLGEAGALLLAGQRVAPRKLLAGGFEFRHPVLRAALQDLLLR